MQPQSHILILGGTGRIGRLVTTELLTQNHKVTALIRKDGAINPQPNLTTVLGSPTSPNDILTALSSIKTSSPIPQQITIISTLGQTRKSGNPWSATTSPRGFMAESTKAVIDGIRSFNNTNANDNNNEMSKVVKLIQLSMFGTKSSMSNLNCLMRGVMSYSNMAQTVEDHNLVDDVVKGGLGIGDSATLHVPFVLVRAAMLKFDVDVRGEVRVYGDEGEGAGFMPSIQAVDVSAFIVDAVGSSEWDGRTPVISN